MRPAQDQEGVDEALIEAERVARRREQTLLLAESLGAHPEFAEAVADRGISAVIERAEMVDSTGALGRLLLMTMLLSQTIQDNLVAGQPPQAGMIEQAATMISQHYGIPPDIGTHLLGGVYEVCKQAIQRAGRLAGQKEVGDGPATR